MGLSQGFLPYGSTDPSVVIQLPLTSAPVQGPLCPYSSIALPGSSIGSPQFDSVKGMRAANFPDANAIGFQSGYVLTSCTLSSLIMAQLTFQGQISFEVEATAVCYDTTNHLNSGGQPHFSSGYVVPSAYGQGGGNNMCAMYLGGASLTEALQLFKPNGSGQFDLLVNPGNVQTGGQGYWKRQRILTTVDSPNTGQCSFTEASNVSQYNSLKTVATGGPTGQVHSYGKGQFVRINIYWQGNWVTLAVDGLDWLTIRRTGPTYPVTDTWPGYLSLGCAGSGNNALGFFMRNFQMSTALPHFQTKPKFSRVHIIGDSTSPYDPADRSVQFVGQGGGDTNRCQIIRKAFQQLGYYVEVFGVNLTGYTIDDNSGASTTCLGAFRDTITPKAVAGGFPGMTGSPPPSGMPWPDAVVIAGGINDFASDGTGVGDAMQNPPIFLQDSRFYASLKKLINYYLWGSYVSTVVSGGTRTPTSRVVIMTPMSPRWKGSQPQGWGTGTPINQQGHGYYGFQYILNTIRNAPLWWNASYPTYSGLVSVADYNTFVGGDAYPFGGTTPGSGSVNPPFISADGVHPLGPQGEYAMGQCLAQELVRVFNLS